MKNQIFIFLILAVNISAYSQWDSTQIGKVTTTDNVGIGTSSPNIWFQNHVVEINNSRPVLSLKSLGTLGTIVFTNSAVNSSNHHGEFHMNHSYSSVDPSKSRLSFGTYPGGSALAMLSNGNVGIGTAEPTSDLEISKDGESTYLRIDADVAKQAAIEFSKDGSQEWIIYQPGSSEDLRIYDTDGVSDAVMTFKTGGYVGIGTTNPDSKLAVKGTIHSEEVKVDLNVPAPDYVFEPDYELRTLKETKEYIIKNKHLPEIPSAAEIGENGIDLGDMNMRLLKKIEELTLYQIELMEKLEEQQKRIERLEEKD